MAGNYEEELVGKADVRDEEEARYLYWLVVAKGYWESSGALAGSLEEVAVERVNAREGEQDRSLR